MQTQIPLESFWNKKWFSILLTIALFFAIMGILYAAGGETKDFKPQLEAWQSEYNKALEEEAAAKIRKCEEIKQGAALKILANATDSEAHPLTEGQMVDLMKKRDMSCTERVAWIPTAKALSFETSSFNSQNNDTRTTPILNLNRDTAGAIGTSPSKISPKLDLDKLAHAVSIAETGGCTKGTGRTKNNCFGIRYNGRFAQYPTKEASFQDFKRIWSKSYKVFPTPQLAAKWTGNDSPTTWLNTVKKHYF